MRGSNVVSDQPGAVARAGLWATLTGGERRVGRLKPHTIRVLYVLGLVCVIGVGIMSLADIFRSSAAPNGTVGGSSEAISGYPPGGLTGSSSGGTTPAQSASAPGLWIRIGDLEGMVEAHLEGILSKIAGAGRVSVAVSFETGATYVYGYDEVRSEQSTRETDSAGGTRVVSQTSSTRSVVVVPQGSGSLPVVVKVEIPPIQGVVVVAGGAADSRVKALLSQAVQVLYKVPAHKVVVLSGG